MMKGFVCPGECSWKMRVVFFRCSSLRLIGFWLMLKILLCFRAAIFAFVNFVLADILAADTVAFLRIEMRFSSGAELGDFLLVSFLGNADARVLVVIGEMFIEEFAARDAGSLSSIGAELPCCWLVVVIGADECPGASWGMVVFWCSLVVCFSIRAALAAWVFSAK